MEDFSKYLLKANTPEDDTIRALQHPGYLFSPVVHDDDDDDGENKFTVLDDSGEVLACSSPLTNNKTNETQQNIHKDKMKFSIKEDIAASEWSIEKYRSQINESGIKDIIVSRHYKKNLLLIQKIEEITKRINEKHAQYKKNTTGPVKPTYYARDLRFEDGMSCMETSCMRSVRETCESISSYFDKEFSKEVSLPVDPSDNDCNTTQFWSKAEDIVHNCNPVEIHEALLKNIQQTTENLKELSSRIDLKRDAENLKFKFETGKIKDISSAPALLKTVWQLIEMGQISHFQRFIVCEKENNGTWDMKKKLQLLNGEIDDILKNKFDLHQSELIRKYFHAEEEHGSCIASYNYLQEELSRLRSEQREKESTMALLLEKYDKIQNFDKTVQAKQLIIQKLIQINGSAKSRHRQQHGDIVKLVKDKIKKKQREISDLCDKYKELAGEELDIFMKVPIQNLNCFKQQNEDKKLLCDMSINCLNPQFHHDGDDSLKHILKKVDIPVYSAPENMISDIMEMKHDCYTYSEKTNSFRVNAEELADTHVKISNVTEHLNKLYKDQSLMTCLKEGEEKTSEIMGECLKFQNAAQVWWEQPAQYLVPWVKVDGFNIQQYLDQFTMYGELLKQTRDVSKKDLKS